MDLYSYVATNANGRIVRGKESADSIQELVEILKEKELYCSDYEIVAQKQDKVKYRFKTKKLAVLCRQLSAMLASGVNLVRAIHILTAQEPNKEARKVLVEIYSDLQKGIALSEALIRQPGAFPQLFVSMVAAGEASGNLDNIMERVSIHYIKEAKLKNATSNALIYPCVLMFGLIALVVAIFVVVLPMFKDMLGTGENAPILTQILLGISDFLIEKWYVVIAVIAAIVALILLIRKIEKVRLWFDKVKCTMPVVGDLVTTIYTARFARTMANLFASGLQMVESIQKSIDTINNRYIKMKFAEVIEDLKRGESLSASVAKTGVFKSLFVSTIYVGEESGRLDEVLEKSADFYDEESDAAVKKLVTLIEPVMIIFIGLFVAVILAAVLTSMYATYNTV